MVYRVNRKVSTSTVSKHNEKIKNKKTNKMIMNRKIVFLLGIFSLIIIGGLIIKINDIKDELQNAIKINSDRDLKKEIITRKQMKFNFYRVFAMPHDCFVNINKGKKFKSYVGLSVGNTEWEKPFVIIGDSVSIDGQLLGKVDTFYTDKGVALIEKEYFEVGEKKLFGKYIVKFSESKTYTILDFELYPMIVNSKDTINTYELIIND